MLGNDQKAGNTTRHFFALEETSVTGLWNDPSLKFIAFEYTITCGGNRCQCMLCASKQLFMMATMVLQLQARTAKEKMRSCRLPGTDAYLVSYVLSDEELCKIRIVAMHRWQIDRPLRTRTDPIHQGHIIISKVSDRECQIEVL